LPPALRKQIPPTSFDDQGSRLPADHRSPRRIPTMASRVRNRPVAAVEALRDEATWKPVDAGSRTESQIPGTLPSDDEANAEPLRKPPPEAAPSRQAPRSQAPGANRAGFNADDGAFFAPAPIASASTRLGARLSALRQAGADVDDSAERADLDHSDSPMETQADELGPETLQIPASQSTLRVSPAGLNTPAAIGMRQASSGVRHASAVADFTISAPDSSMALAVRAVGGDGWGQSAPIGNPLRGGSKITRVVFETAAAEESTDKPAASTLEASTADLAVPANPLR
jgi:hypothetical protein